jgi:bacillolysin
MSGKVEHIRNLNVTPSLAAATALRQALAFVGARQYRWDDPAAEAALRRKQHNPAATYRPQGELVIVRNTRTTKAAQRDKPTLAWKFDIYATAPLSHAYVYVDAHTGQIVSQDAIIKHANSPATFATRYSGTQTSTTESFSGGYRLRETSRGGGIETYNARGSNSFLDAVDFVNADNSWTEYNNAVFDNAALDAHWGAQAVYDYWKNVQGRNSYDGQGAKIKSYVHFDHTPNDGQGMENAFWSKAEGAILYGDGDTQFQPLTSLDICAHEIGHAICDYTAELVYQNESGALNEGFSDIWGAVVEHYKAPGKQPWLIGEDLVKQTGRTCLRSMSEPASEQALTPGPSYYKGPGWYEGPNDNGGVHINSGVLNHWFYILSAGKSGTNWGGNAYSVTGIGAAANIAYRAESVYLSKQSQYADARTYTIQAATDLYGAGSPQVMATTNAWYAVGVGAAYSGGGGTYCASQGSNQDYWIGLVSVGNINRISGPEAGGYYNGMATTNTNVAAGSVQTIAYSAGFASAVSAQNWGIYIDYN